MLSNFWGAIRSLCIITACIMILGLNYAYAGSDAAVSVLNTTGSGTVTITVKNMDGSTSSDGIIRWTGTSAEAGAWRPADQYIEISHSGLPEGWGMQIYTDNENSTPAFTGKGNPAGLVRVDKAMLTVPLAWRISDRPLTAAQLSDIHERFDAKGMTDYLWHFIKDKNTPDTNNIAGTGAVITGMSIVGGKMQLTIRNISGALSYNIYGRASLTSESWQLIEENYPASDGESTQWIDPNLFGQTGFYKVEVAQAEGSFVNGEDYITFWNQKGIAIGEGQKAGNPAKAYLYLNARFITSPVGVEYKTTTLTIEAYHGVSAFPFYVYKDGAPAVQMAYEHISSKMDKYFKGTEKRLIESYSYPYPPGLAGNLEAVAFTYDNALAVSAYLARPTQNNLLRAKRVCQSLMHAQEPDGRLRDAYYASDNFDITPEPAAATGFDSVSTGNIAFFINALMHYYKNSGDTDTEFLVDIIGSAVKAGDFIHNNFYHSHATLGGYYHGHNTDSTLNTSKSTEHNIAVYVAFSHLYDVTEDSKWLTRANIAKNFVNNVAWQQGHKRYICGLNANGGLNENTLVSDTNLLAVIAMGSLAKNNDAIIYTVNTFSASDTQRGLEGIDFGYNVHDSGTEPDGIWFEGTAQLAAAYKIAGYYGYTDNSDRYLESIKRAQHNALNANYKGITAASKDYLTTGLGWYYFASPHIASTAWFAAAKLGYNMLWGTALNEAIPLPGDNRKFTADPDSLTDGTAYMQNHYTPMGFMNYFPGAVIVDSRCTENPYSGDTCFKISWNGANDWAGIVWQEPENEWHGGPGKGYDLRGADYFSFWARTDDFSYVPGKDLRIQGYFGYRADSCGQRLPIFREALTTEWQQFTIPTFGLDMSHVANGFTIGFNDTNTPRPDHKFNIYIDEVKFGKY
jgi:hypothetical protein